MCAPIPISLRSLPLTTTVHSAKENSNNSMIIFNLSHSMQMTGALNLEEKLTQTERLPDGWEDKRMDVWVDGGR